MNPLESFYSIATIDEVNIQLDILRLMEAIGYRFDKYHDGAKQGKGFCPIHREGIFRNLVIDKEERTFKCQYQQCPGSQGGTLVSLFAQARGIDIDSAVRFIVRDQSLNVELPVNQQYIKSHLQKAERNMESRLIEAAEVLYLEILEGDPHCADARLGLMKIAEARGDEATRRREMVEGCRLKIAAGEAADVADLIREWAETDVDSPEARLACAELLFTEGDAEGAVMEYMGAGDACEGRAELDAALTAYQRADTISREQNIDIIDVTPHIVRVLLSQNRLKDAVHVLTDIADRAEENDAPDQAIEAMVMAIDVDPDNPTTRRRFLDLSSRVAPSSVISEYVIQSALYLRDHHREHDYAITALENFVAIAPDDEDALLALVNEYNNNGRAEAAFDLEARLARLYFDAGRQGDARDIIERVLTWHPQHIPTLETLLYIQIMEGLEEDSRETQRRLIRSMLDAKRFDDAMNAVEMYLGQAAPSDEDAIDLRASALEGIALQTQDNVTREQAVAALVDLGDRFMEHTTSRRAIGYLQRAIDLQEAPDSELLFKLARAHLRNKDISQVRDTVIMACEHLASRDRLDEAILEAERYSNLIPGDTDLVRYLVELYLRFDDRPAAVARMRRLAQELEQAGRTVEAEEIAEQANDLEPQSLETLSRQLAGYRESNRTDKIQQCLLKIAGIHEHDADWPLAAGTLEEYLKLNPDDASAVLRLINSYDKQDDATLVRQWRLNLARIYRSAEDTDREVRVLRDILTTHPGDDETLTMLSDAEFRRGDMAAGVTVTRRLAQIYRETDQPEQARRALMRAIEHVPENLDINRDVYELHRHENQPNQALTYGRKLINLLRISGRIPDAAAIYEQLIELDESDLKLKQEQLAFLEEAGRNHDVIEKRLVLATLYKNQERYKEAEAMLNAILKADARHVDARLQLADLSLHLGETAKAEYQWLHVASVLNLEGQADQAIAILEKLLLNNPVHAEARKQLSLIYRAQGRMDDAVSQLLELAQAFRQQDMEVEALAAEREAAEMAPGNAEITRRFVDNLKAAGRIDQAVEVLEQWATHHTANEEFGPALDLLNEGLDLLPGRLSARKMRSELYIKTGKTEEAMQELRTIADLAVTGQVNGATAPAARQDSARYPLQIVPEYVFENFVVGTNNDFAYATAMAIARSPARAYNPLFLYANVGLGKTHLCNAIANYLLQHEPRAHIIYTNCEDFTDELIEAIQNNAVPQFRNRYRNLDLLIVDDVQFLTGKERAQEEFFHIFNNLFQARRQIVITSDRPPAEIAHLENRLRSRFGAGVIVDIASPDIETRLAILNREVQDSKTDLDPWVVPLLAERVDSNIRDLKGALNQVLAMRDLRKVALTEAGVNKMLDHLYPPTTATS